MRKFMRWLFGLFIPDDHDPDEWVREAQRGAVEHVVAYEPFVVEELDPEEVEFIEREREIEAWHVLKRPED